MSFSTRGLKLVCAGAFSIISKRDALAGDEELIDERMGGSSGVVLLSGFTQTHPLFVGTLIWAGRVINVF